LSSYVLRGRRQFIPAHRARRTAYAFSLTGVQLVTMSMR
jgi:hypothetical protein